MGGLMEAAAAVMRSGETRLDVAARNVANASSPGFKRQATYAALAAAGGLPATGVPTLSTLTDVRQGKLEATGNPLDLAITGDGFFAVNTGTQLRYIRQGAFSLRSDGAVVTPQGFVLQQAGGGDLVLDRAAVHIDADGTVLDGDRPVARIALFAGDAPKTSDGVMFDLPNGAHDVDGSTIRQGMLEASNVSTGDEMVAIMGAIREAESGARLAQTWDDLLGRAITSFGQGGR